MMKSGGQGARWVRFSLRTALLAVFAIAIGVSAWRVYQQQSELERQRRIQRGLESRNRALERQLRVAKIEAILLGAETDSTKREQLAAYVRLGDLGESVRDALGCPSLEISQAMLQRGECNVPDSNLMLAFSDLDRVCAIGYVYARDWQGMRSIRWLDSQPSAGTLKNAAPPGEDGEESAGALRWSIDRFPDKPLVNRPEMTRQPTQVVFAPRQPVLLMGARCGVNLWNLRNPTNPDFLYAAEFVETCNGSYWTSVKQIAFNHDGSRCATGGRNVILWDTSTWRMIAQLGDPGGFAAIVFSPDGALLAVSGNELGIYSADDGALKGMHAESWCDTPCFSPDSRYVYADGCAAGEWENGGIRIYDVTGLPFDSQPWKQRADLVPDATTLSPDGRVLAAYCRDPMAVQLMNARTLEDIAALPNSQLEAWYDLSPPVIANSRCLQFSPNGETLFLQSAAGEVRLWRVDRRSYQGSLSPKSPAGNAEYRHGDAAYSPDGNSIAHAYSLADGQSILDLWDVAEKRLIMRREFATDRAVRGPVTFSPDGHAVALVDHLQNGVLLVPVSEGMD